jgi:hypothetical protein
MGIRDMEDQVHGCQGLTMDREAGLGEARLGQVQGSGRSVGVRVLEVRALHDLCNGAELCQRLGGHDG